MDKNRCWAALANGTLWYSTDGGVSWTQRTGNGLPGAGAYRGLWFVNEYQGFLIHNTAVPVGTVYITQNGGWSWEALTTPTNTGLNYICAVNASLAFICGEVTAATSFIAKITRSSN